MPGGLLGECRGGKQPELHTRTEIQGNPLQIFPYSILSLQLTRGKKDGQEQRKS